MNIETLSDVPFFAGRPSRAVAPKRKVATWIAVGIVHLLFLALLMTSETFPSLLHKHGATLETIIDLPGNSSMTAPAVRMVVPQAPTGTPPEILLNPVIVPPPPQPQPEEDEGSNERGDLLGAIGREIACGATNYEQLTSQQRLHCRRVPWQGARLPNGDIVMLPHQDRPNLFAPQPEYRISGADAQRRAGETAPACSMILNTPCLNRVPGN